MMVETVLESSQDFGMSCVWKREVCRRPPPPSPPPPVRAPPPEEELRYGPGIVSRLKSRYLSLTTPELRRASSLETLEEAPPPAPPPAPRLPRARSVEALSPVRRPRRPTPLVPPAQRPAAAVKDSARRYDPPRRTPAPRVSAVVREFEARAGVRSNGTKYWSRPPPCVVSATNPVLVGSRRVGVIRPLPARAPSPRPPPSPSPRPPLSPAPPSPRPRDRTEHSEDQVDKSPQAIERPMTQIDRSPTHQEKSPPSAMVEPMPRFEEKLSIVQLWEQRISESPEKIVPKPKVDHILPPKPEITTPKPEGITKPHFPTLKVEGVVKQNHTSPKVDGITKPNLSSPKPEPVTKPSFPSPKTELITKSSLPSPKPDAIPKPNFSTPKLENGIKNNHLPSHVDSSPKLMLQMPKYDTVTKPSFPSPKTEVPAAKSQISSPFIETVNKPSFASPKPEIVTKPSFPSPKTDVPAPKSHITPPIVEAINKPSFPSPKADVLTPNSYTASPIVEAISKTSLSSPKTDVPAPKSQFSPPIVEAINKPSFPSPKTDAALKSHNISSPIVEAINKPMFASPKPELVSESVIRPNCQSPKTETISNKPDLIKIECKKTEPLTNGHKEKDNVPELAEPKVSEKIVGISEKIAKLDKISNTEKTFIEKQKEKSPEPILNGTCKISAAKIDRPWTKCEKESEVSASVTVSESSPVRRHVREAPGSNSVVFNFSSRKEVPDYIENDGLILKAAKRDKIKAGDPGVVVLCPDLVRDLDDDDDEEELETGPPSPCGVRFVNDNVLINGKSSLSHSATKCRNNKPRLQFDDSLTRTFEYPSETSLCEDTTPSDSTNPQSPHNSLPTNTHISSSSLCAYSPWKTPRDTAALGLSPLTHSHHPHSPTNGDAHTEVEKERPPSPPSWTEARTTNTDLLF